MPLYTTIIPICPIYPNTSPVYPHIKIYQDSYHLFPRFVGDSDTYHQISTYHDHITHITITLKNSAPWLARTSPSNSSMIFPTELPWLGHVVFFLCSIATLFLTEGLLLLLLLLLLVCLTTDVANDLMMPQFFQDRD